MIITEFFAVIDLVTDIKILYDLIKSEHIAWSSLTILTMIAPFLICHIPYLSFLTQKFNNLPYNKRDCKQKFFGFIMVSPLMILFLFFMDVWFLVVTVLTKPIVWISCKLCGSDA